MNLDKHEKIIKEKMRAFRPEPDKEALLEYINQTVAVEDRRKKKRRLVFLLIFFIPLLLVNGIFILNKNEHDIKAKKHFDKNQYLNKQHPQYNNPHIKKSKSTNKIIANNLEADDLDYGEHSTNSNQSTLSKKQSISLNKHHLLSQDKNLSELKEELGINDLKVVKQNNPNDKNNRRSMLNREIKNLYSIGMKTPTLLFDYDILLKPDISKIDFSKYRHKTLFRLFMSAGSGWFTHDFVPKNAESIEYAQQIEAKTKPGINIEMGMSYHFMNKFYLSSGFQFTQLVTQIHPKWEKLLSEQNPYYNGLSQRLQRQLEYEAIGHNYQNILDIPVIMGLEIFNLERVNLAVETGFVVNIYTFSKGVILDDKYKLHYYNEYSGNPYKNFCIGWQTSVVLNYKLDNNNSFYLKPTFTRRNISYNFSSLNIQEKFRIYNIKLGFNYKI